RREAVENPLRGVPLLSRPTFIRRQDPVDGPGKRIQFRTRRRSAPPVSGWDRKRQHLGYCPRVNAKLPRRFPSAQTLDPYGNYAKGLPAAVVLLRRNRTDRPLQ